MDFHFLVMEKSWKINVEKEGAPWSTRVKCTSVNCDQSCRTAVRPQSSLIFWSVIITVCWCDASDIADCAKCTGEIFHIGDAFSTCLPMRSVIVCWSSFVVGNALVLGTSVLETSLKHLLPAVSARDIVLGTCTCRGVSINDSVSVDLGIDYSGAIANNELVVGISNRYFWKPS